MPVSGSHICSFGRQLQVPLDGFYLLSQTLYISHTEPESDMFELSQPSIYILVGSLTLLLTLGFKWFKSMQKTQPLPPGPRPLPIIGNLYDIPKALPWLKYHEWSKKYGNLPVALKFRICHSNNPLCDIGDVVYLEIPAQPTIVLNSIQAALELLDRLAAIYSSRPIYVMDTL